MTSQAVRYDRGSPRISVINKSKRVSDAELARVVRAMQKQIDRDFFPLWGWRAKLVLGTARGRAMKINIIDEPDEEDALGYHFIDGLPVSHVFTEDEDGKAVEFHSVLSHELLEMIVDPGANLYAYGYYIKSKRHYKAWIGYEVCDPVQSRLYEIDGIRVSDFVVPEWFEMERERNSMKFSFLGSVKEPFEIARGGYLEAVVGTRIRTVERARRKRRRHRREVRACIGDFRG